MPSRLNQVIDPKEQVNMPILLGNVSALQLRNNRKIIGEILPVNASFDIMSLVGWRSVFIPEINAGFLSFIS